MQQLFVQGIIGDCDYHYQPYARDKASTRGTQNAAAQVKGEEGIYSSTVQISKSAN